jgi:glutamine synthetase adenylyltransferase
VDAEFVAQALCLENGWNEPSTLGALERAYSEGCLPMAEELIVSYLRLRRVEVVLRRWSCEGETLLPTDAAAYERVSIRCGYVSSEAFQSALVECREALRKAYEAFFLIRG